MSFLRLIAFLVLAVAWLPAQRVVYLLAGQSNIANLSVGTPDTTLQLANVRYWFTPTFGSQNIASAPLMQLGYQLGQAHTPATTVDIVQIASVGSALLQANAQPPFGHWLPTGTNSILDGLRTSGVMQLFMPATALRIIWSQGETDMLSNISADEYFATVQQVFATLSGFFPGVPVEVYLAVPGALDPNPCTGSWNDDSVNSVRDAYNDLHHLPSSPFPMRIVAHHYDLEHALVKCNNVFIRDVHLSFNGYVEFGRRIGYGIVNPSTYFDVRGSTFTSNTIDLLLSDVALTPPATATKMFLTTIRSGGTVTQVLPTSVTQVAPAALQLTYTGVNFMSAQSVLVRHVPGAGTSTAWQTQAVHSAKQLPLASRLIVVR